MTWLRCFQRQQCNYMHCSLGVGLCGKTVEGAGRGSDVGNDKQHCTYRMSKCQKDMANYVAVVTLFAVFIRQGKRLFCCLGNRESLHVQKRGVKNKNMIIKWQRFLKSLFLKT